MDIYEEVRRGQEQAEHLFKKALSPTLNEMVEDIKKAKAAQVGEIREWGGVKMQKTAQGWTPVKNGSKAVKGEDEPSGKEPKVDLAEHAKNASEQALMNATKTSPDPAVREAAHKEMMRRKSEEATETFKAPEEAAPKKTGKGGEDPGRSKDGNEYDEEGKPIGGKKPFEKPVEKKEEKKVEKGSKMSVEEFNNGIEEDGIDFLEKVDKGAAKLFMQTLSKVEKETRGGKGQDGDWDLANKKAKQAVIDKYITKGAEKKVEVSTPKNNYGIKSKTIQEWVGDDYSDSQINEVMDTLYEEGQVEKESLKVNGAQSQLHESRLVDEKVDRLMKKVRPGMWPVDLKDSDIKDILWGVVMSSK